MSFFRAFLCLVVLLLALIACEPPTTTTTTTTSTVPSTATTDVLWVQLDDASTDAWRFYMPQTVAMLHGEHWYDFTQAVVPTPLCGPKRSSDLTGQTVDHHGMSCHINSQVCPQWNAVRDKTFTKSLDNAGMRVGWYGKRTNWEHECGGPDGKTNGLYQNLPGVEDDRVHYRDTQEMFNKYALIENGVEVNYDTTVRPSDYGTYKTADLAVNGIENLCAGPDACAIVWNPQAPHAPGTPAPDFDPTGVVPGLVEYQPPFREGCAGAVDPSDADKPWLIQNQWDAQDCPGPNTWKRSKYYASLQAVDNRLPELVEQFLQTSPERSKRIIFTSDHGQELGNHGHVGKEVPYDTSVRVPLFIYDSDAPGGTVDRLVNALDLNATILDWTDASPLLTPDGTSLVPRYLGVEQFAIDTYMSHLQIQKGVYDLRPWRAVRDNCAVANPCYKLVRYPASTVVTREGVTMSLGEEWELYDLSADPWELTNLLPNSVTGYAGQPGWDFSNPVVVDLMARLAAHEAAGK